ncbi:MAG: family ATPase [Marmoricola sp.]|nr:family ATPase [Marmoricola sp.]
MRLHHLTMTAFGPFGTTADVDFDGLSAAGLFLLTGATGAGKTSILDAVCFALYGQVPGDRAGAKHLRSDHAAPQAAPLVTLRLSIGERELRFTRSPAWSRPKLRGSGETKVQAHVLVEEHLNGSWTALTTRLDDAGLLVTALLGMTSTQFTQVALLPQGRFQAFLRATSAERHAVLQQLFRTNRFERIEQWLVERRTTDRRASEAVAESVVETLNRLAEAAAVADLPAWIDELTDAVARDDVRRWAEAVTADAAAVAADTAGALRAAELLDASHSAALAVGTRLQELRSRGTRAARELALLDQHADELELARSQVERHRRARPLGPLVQRTRDTARSSAYAAQAWSARVLALEPVLGTAPTRDALVGAHRDAQAALALARAFGSRDRARLAAASRLAVIRERLQEIETGVAELDVVLTDQPSELADALQASHEARAAAARLPDVTAAAERLDVLIAAARRAEVVGLELVAARTDVLAAQALAQDGRERYLDVREARINGMAGELAGRLAVGCSCPVCGSAEHPAPARTEAGAIGRSEEEQARKVLEDAEFELQARRDHVVTLEGEQAALDARLDGHDRDRLPAELAATVAEVERLEPLAGALDVLVAREQECRTRGETADKERAAALLERATLRAEAQQHEVLITATIADRDALLAAPGAAPDEEADDDLDRLLELRGRFVEILDASVRDHDAAAAAAAAAEEATVGFAQAAAVAGFTDAVDVDAALLAEDLASELQRRVAEADRQRHGADQVLADQEVAAAVADDPVDLEALVAAHDASMRSVRVAASARDAAVAKALRVTELGGELGERLAAWEPLRAQHALTANLAALVEGKSVDNPLRMRLAAYVLSERLRQVVAAANERLARMTDQRYSLEHTDARGYGEQRGGLSLRVRDDWNGVHRDPATLSGGETFVVSLALALGLADTVAHEAGGTDIDTLFIDEGFGSLDADTLDDVMDTLDSLRDGGRVVGLVSHVPELRSRITTQLEVTKGRTGSTIRPVVAHI